MLGRIALFMLAALTLPACGDNSLHGSISNRFPITYRSIKLYARDTTLVVDYDADPDTVCRVVIDTAGQSFATGSTVDGAAFVSQVKFQRAASDGQLYPAVLSGNLTFDTYHQAVGEKFAAHFSTIFVGGDTLVGSFAGTLAAAP